MTVTKKLRVSKMQRKRHLCVLLLSQKNREDAPSVWTSSPAKGVAPKLVKSIIVLIVGLSTIYKTWKQTMLVNLCMDKENGAHTGSGLLFSHKKEWNHVSWDNTIGTTEYSAMWRKPGIRKTRATWSPLYVAYKMSVSWKLVRKGGFLSLDVWKGRRVRRGTEQWRKKF